MVMIRPMCPLASRSYALNSSGTSDRALSQCSATLHEAGEVILIEGAANLVASLKRVMREARAGDSKEYLNEARARASGLRTS